MRGPWNDDRTQLVEEQIVRFYEARKKRLFYERSASSTASTLVSAVSSKSGCGANPSALKAGRNLG